MDPFGDMHSPSAWCLLASAPVHVVAVTSVASSYAEGMRGMAVIGGTLGLGTLLAGAAIIAVAAMKKR